MSSFIEEYVIGFCAIIQRGKLLYIYVLGYGYVIGFCAIIQREEIIYIYVKFLLNPSSTGTL